MGPNGKCLAMGVLAAVGLLAGSVQAQTAEPVARPPDAAAQDAAIDTWINDAARDETVLAPDAAATSPAPRRIHGEVGAAFGSGGYRSAYGYVAVPFGQASLVTLAAADGRWSGRRWGGGEQRSLSIGLYLDGRDVSRLFDRRSCNMRQWAVGLKEDAVFNEDGTCDRKR